MELPEPIAGAVKPLLQHLPLDRAMPELTPKHAAPFNVLKMVEQIIQDHPEVGGSPPLCAGLWLYVDDLDRSHAISQGIETPTGWFWHAIMHRREGDFSNSHYWYRRVGWHPAMDALPEYNGHEFVDEVEAHHVQNPEPLVGRQRLEWAALFTWCAREISSEL
ncbi:MAG: hypothetical protein HYZ00_08055 [Candidatus Hydrogenedentes bacterium]|nr:hypothetical protein [Candidatus Hydrogenedentota bacterium]